MFITGIVVFIGFDLKRKMKQHIAIRQKREKKRREEQGSPETPEPTAKQLSVFRVTKTTIFIPEIPSNVTKEMIKSDFSAFGHVVATKVHSYAKRSKIGAFVQFQSHRVANLVFQTLKSCPYYRRMNISVLWAHRPLVDAEKSNDTVHDLEVEAPLASVLTPVQAPTIQHQLDMWHAMVQGRHHGPRSPSVPMQHHQWPSPLPHTYTLQPVYIHPAYMSSPPAPIPLNGISQPSYQYTIPPPYAVLPSQSRICDE